MSIEEGNGFADWRVIFACATWPQVTTITSTVRARSYRGDDSGKSSDMPVLKHRYGVSARSPRVLKENPWRVRAARGLVH